MWQPVNQQGNLSDRIVTQVERLIADESLRPGDRLPSERDMAALLKVSRPSLREAVRILEARGRLVVKHGQGVFVQEPRSERALRHALAATEVTLNELFAMREVLEVPATGWAAERIDATKLRDLRGLLDQMRSMIDKGKIDFDRLASLDVDFHLGIAAAAGNRFLRQTHGVLHNMILSGMETTLSIPGRPQIALRDHEAIFAALSEHDAAGARRAARTHIRGAHKAALNRVAEEEAAKSIAP